MRCLWVVGTDLCWAYLVVDKMHDMHLQIHELTVNGVLSWGVEMELLSVEVSSWDVLVEKADGCSVHKVLGGQLVVWLLCLLDWEEE